MRDQASIFETNFQKISKVTNFPSGRALILLTSMEMILVINSCFSAVREDKKRGGKNKFNSFYMMDRKERVALRMESQPEPHFMSAGNQDSRV